MCAMVGSNEKNDLCFTRWCFLSVFLRCTLFLRRASKNVVMTTRQAYIAHTVRKEKKKMVFGVARRSKHKNRTHFHDSLSLWWRWKRKKAANKWLNIARATHCRCIKVFSRFFLHICIAACFSRYQFYLCFGCSRQAKKKLQYIKRISFLLLSDYECNKFNASINTPEKNHRQHNNREINTSTPFDSSVESIIPDEYMWNLCSLFYARFCVFFVSPIFLSASKHCSWIRNWCFPILALSLSLN